jgi:hypothetical protein
VRSAPTANIPRSPERRAPSPGKLVLKAVLAGRPSVLSSFSLTSSSLPSRDPHVFNHIFSSLSLARAHTHTHHTPATSSSVSCLLFHPFTLSSFLPHLSHSLTLSLSLSLFLFLPPSLPPSLPLSMHLGSSKLSCTRVARSFQGLAALLYPAVHYSHILALCCCDVAILRPITFFAD